MPRRYDDYAVRLFGGRAQQKNLPSRFVKKQGVLAVCGDSDRRALKALFQVFQFRLQKVRAVQRRMASGGQQRPIGKLLLLGSPAALQPGPELDVARWPVGARGQIRD